jgi:hypothetical protein
MYFYKRRRNRLPKPGRPPMTETRTTVPHASHQDRPQVDP